MKKFAIITLALVMVLSCIGLTACDFSSISGVEITVYTNGVAETYKAGLNKTVSIDPGTKNGYYLTGYYTAETGGEKYFDVNGESVSTWNKSFPTVFYAQWKPIEGFETSVVTWGSKSFSPHTGSATSNPGTRFYWEIENEAKNLIMGNLNKTIKISVWGKIKAPVSMTVKLQDTGDSNAEVYYTQSLWNSTPSDEYEYFDFRAICSAKIFKDNYRLYINFLGGFSFSEAHVKDLSAKFTVPQQ